MFATSPVRTADHRVLCGNCHHFHLTAAEARTCAQDMETEARIDRCQNDRMFADPPETWEP